MFKKQAGMTLIELLVALSIYALLATTMIMLISNTHRTYDDLEAKTFAKLALDNVMSERLQRGSLNQNARGEVRLSHFDFSWRTYMRRTQNSRASIVYGEIRQQGSDDILYQTHSMAIY